MLMKNRITALHVSFFFTISSLNTLMYVLLYILLSIILLFKIHTTWVAKNAAILSAGTSLSSLLKSLFPSMLSYSLYISIAI